jgi:hypothetical protein
VFNCSELLYVHGLVFPLSSSQILQYRGPLIAVKIWPVLHNRRTLVLPSSKQLSMDLVVDEPSMHA